MNVNDIVKHRLTNQQIIATNFSKPEEIVSCLGAMQAQEYAFAKWAIGLRLPALFETDIEQAFNEGVILRTHILRPTWHFVAPADIRWMLKLTAPGVQAFNAYYYRKYKLDETVFKRANKILIKELRDSKHLTRKELNIKFKEAGIIADELRLACIMMYAELEGLICSGPRRGKQFTYALLDERVKKTYTRKPDEALAELTLRYFNSRGPATIHDFAWWSGLSMAVVKKGILLNTQKLSKEVINGQEYWLGKDSQIVRPKYNRAFLLPDYDEYGISYKDRSAFSYTGPPVMKKDTGPASTHTIVINGKSAGTWKSTFKANAVIVQINTFTQLNKTDKQTLEKAVKRYAAFFGKKLES
ncbi:MAG: AlkZ family DNA glycosylase [Chitinophagales bacterium]|nr:AlkZ family DNA glycosylase [Chitinophagales bacterium]